jgi:hypothetical protein
MQEIYNFQIVKKKRINRIQITSKNNLKKVLDLSNKYFNEIDKKIRNANNTLFRKLDRYFIDNIESDINGKTYVHKNCKSNIKSKSIYKDERPQNPRFLIIPIHDRINSSIVEPLNMDLLKKFKTDEKNIIQNEMNYNIQYRNTFNSNIDESLSIMNHRTMFDFCNFCIQIPKGIDSYRNVIDSIESNYSELKIVDDFLYDKSKLKMASKNFENNLNLNQCTLLFDHIYNEKFLYIHCNYIFKMCLSIKENMEEKIKNNKQIQE